MKELKLQLENKTIDISIPIDGYVVTLEPTPAVDIPFVNGNVTIKTVHQNGVITRSYIKSKDPVKLISEFKLIKDQSIKQYNDSLPKSA